jgi:hypothetical protein
MRVSRSKTSPVNSSEKASCIPARNPQPKGSPALQTRSASQLSSGRCWARRTCRHGPWALQHASSDAGNVRLELKTSRSPLRKNCASCSNFACWTVPLLRSITSSRTLSRPTPRRSGGSLALSSSGSVKLNGALTTKNSPKGHHGRQGIDREIYFSSSSPLCPVREISPFQSSCA